MKRLLVYDLPTRFFHWTFAGLLVASYLIAQASDSESSVFPYHMILGLTLAFVAVLRIIWGIIGSHHARFSSFALRPSQMVAYIKDLLKRDAKVYTGHNPASSWTAIVMLLLAIGLAVTGVLMVERVNKEVLEEVHELFANAFLVGVIAHVGGVVFHMMKHRDGLAMSMLHGRKQVREGEMDGISKAYSEVGLGFLALVAVVLFLLARGYDSQTQELKVFGSTLQLGEGEHENAAGKD